MTNAGHFHKNITKNEECDLSFKKNVCFRLERIYNFVSLNPCLNGSPFPTAEDFPAGFLSRDWEDLFSSTLAERLGVSLKEVFTVPWEVDEPVSPPCRDNEFTSSGAEDNQVDEPVRPSAPAKSLIWRGFLGLRAAPPPPMVLKEVSPCTWGRILFRRLGLVLLLLSGPRRRPARLPMGLQ
jgi:hypothetical protein